MSITTAYWSAVMAVTRLNADFPTPQGQTLPSFQHDNTLFLTSNLTISPVLRRGIELGGV
jgi:hypothetical protein